MNNAARRMNGKKANAFILWCYLITNADGFIFGLSNVAVNQAFGLSRDSYDAAIKVLIEQGFLIRDEQEKECIFDFVEYPDKHKTENVRCGKIPQRGCREIPQRGCGKTPQRGCGKTPQRGCGKTPQRGCGKTPQETIQYLQDNIQDNIQDKEIDKSSSSGSNSSISESVAAAAAAAGLSLNNQIHKSLAEIVSEYGQEVTLEAIKRAVENSSPSESKVTIAYIKRAAQGISRDARMTALQENSGARYDDQDREIWDEDLV